MSTIQFVAKKVKLVELLIIYSQVIKLKVGRCGEAGSSQVYKFASHHLVPILFKIFNLLLLLTRQNKPSSQVIIEHHIIFNELLRDYPEQIGPIVEEAIKNLCILTNQITEEEDVIFSWIAHVQQIS